MDARQAVEERFPKLASDGYRVTSAPTDRYNCVAWVARDVHGWWAPGVDGFHWPLESEDDSLINFIELFRSLGFESSQDGSVEPGIEKIAIYGTGDEFDHVAFQRADGTWSSKLGELADVRHNQVGSITGPGLFEYSAVIEYMRRPRQPHPLAEGGLILAE